MCGPFFDKQNGDRSESLTQKFTFIFSALVQFVTFHKTGSGSGDISLLFL